MSDYRDKPWMRPVQYNDDRFEPPVPEKRAWRMGDGPGPTQDERRAGEDAIDDIRDRGDVEELLRRPDRQEDREYECNDTTPIDYKKGPHDEEFGVDDKEFETPDSSPVPYDNGPHDTEFGIDDAEFESLDGAGEFDES